MTKRPIDFASQRQLDHYTLKLWRAKVWLNERRRQAVKVTPGVPRIIEEQS